MLVAMPRVIHSHFREGPRAHCGSRDHHRPAISAIRAVSDPAATQTTPIPHYHQQYLAKNPYGYRCHANTGVPFPEGSE